MMEYIVLVVIGGIGVYKLVQFDDVSSYQVEICYGMLFGLIWVGMLFGQCVVFLVCYGEGYLLLLYKINYCVNFVVLQQIGVMCVFVFNIVGGIIDVFGLCVLVCLDQLIDYMWGCIFMLCEELGSEVLYVDFGYLYMLMLCSKVLVVVKVIGVCLQDGGCYGVMQGLCLEINVEIVCMCCDGCDLVGMIGMFEVSLVCEFGLDYVCLVIVVNWVVGCGDGDEIMMVEVLVNVDVVLVGLLELIGELVWG